MLPLASIAAPNSDTFQLLNLFGDVFERVKTDYVEEVPDLKLIESAINGMLTSLDPHSSYLNEKAFKEMQVQTKGEFGGLGIEVTMENGLVKVVSPIDDTPAFKAGIHAGDLITQIDDEAVMGLTLQEAVEKMRGPKGSEVRLTVAREGSKEPLEFKLKRDIIHIKSVRTRNEKDIVYLRITSFSEQTAESLGAEIESLKKQMGNKLKGAVLDLRNNPGGLLDQAVDVSDLFLTQGEIVSTRGRDPENTKRFSAREGDALDGLPMVVLINGGSASAAEIVAGALQDHKRAIVLGTKSFGKGSVQTVIPLPGNAAMRLTTARYYTPSGHSIQAKGIEPDILVEQAKLETLKKQQLRSEASLRGRLENEEDKNAAEKKPEISTAPPSKTLPGEEVPESESAKPGEIKPEEDYQLARAMDLLRGLAIYKPEAAAAQ